MTRASDSKQRFTSRVADYQRARPGYPAEVMTLLQRETGLRPQWTVADIGSGTGISTRPFLEFANVVYGVEPNLAMREAAEQALGGFSGFHSVNGSAEATTLVDRSVDLIVAGQAFHWFDAARTRVEFQRILKPGGYVLLMWNVRQKSGSAFLEEYENLLIQYGTDYLKIRHENVGDDDIGGFFGTREFGTARIANAQQQDWDGLRSRCLSSSYLPGVDDPRGKAMLADLRGIFDRTQVDGRVEMQYETELFWGRLAQ